MAVGLLVIVGTDWLIIRAWPTPGAVLYVLVVTAVLALPALGRWPLSRRRCAITAAAWIVLGFGSWALFWVVPLFPVMVAPFAAMPVLIGCGVGWD
jgi:hypothetical protein